MLFIVYHGDKNNDNDDDSSYNVNMAPILKQ